MPFSHPTGIYNVQASLRLWLAQAITTNKPPLISTVSIVFSIPEKGIVAPCWSVHFLGAGAAAEQYEGRIVSDTEHGTRRLGLIEVNCWVSRRDVTWDAMLAQMQDAVTRTVSANTTGVIIKDFYANSAAPVDTTYRIVLGEVEVRQAAIDPNPDIERIRLIIPYQWIERN